MVLCFAFGFGSLRCRNHNMVWDTQTEAVTDGKTRQWRKYSDILLMYLFHLATFSLQKYFQSTSTSCEVLTSTHFKLTSTMDAAAHLTPLPPSPPALLFQPDINQTSPLTAPDPGTT